MRWPTIADILGKTDDAKALRDHAAKYRRSLATLWDAKRGIYVNKDLHTGEFSYRLSPTNFYPLLAKAPTPDQAEEMVRKHLLNPDEFWGERVLPSIARNDPAFHGPGLLARPHLGTDELPGLPWDAELRSARDGRRTTAACEEVDGTLST